MTERYWALVSGGKDSVAMAHVLESRGVLDGVAFIDTGIACPDTRPFVEWLCESRGWELEVARTPVAYEDFVMRYGFPGPPQHSAVMSALKGRAIRGLRRSLGDVVLASGVRRLESERRARNARMRGTIEGVPIVAPIFPWPTDKVWSYLRAHDLGTSPAYATLHMSGDCLCGAFAQPDEPYMIRAFYPELASRIARLEARLAAKRPGCRFKKWGGSVGISGAERQTRMESFLCQSCAGVP